MLSQMPCGHVTSLTDLIACTLQGVSFEVAAGEKVGIVGRTGSGKSSLIVTLFRIVETDGGSITLDGLDLQSMGLNDVRGRIAAIPQDPVLFSGTVRSNLDPYGRYEDHEIWDALSHVALKVQHMCWPLLALFKVSIPRYCLLTPLMSPEDSKCRLLD